MGNFPPDHCPYCGAELVVVDGPAVYRCESREDYVFHNPVPGGSVAVVDDDSLLLVEDFRYDRRRKLPSGAVEVGESVGADPDRRTLRVRAGVPRPVRRRGVPRGVPGRRGGPPTARR